MNNYTYKAKTQAGETQTGKIEARDLTSAATVLREKGMVIISLKPTRDLHSLGILPDRGDRIKFGDLVTLTRQMATMTNSGLPLIEALSVLEVQSKPSVSKVLGDVLRDLQAGSSVVDAMAKHDKVFSPIYLSLIKAGETAGALDSILNRLAENMEKQKEFQAKTKGALIYPVIVTLAMIIVAFLMMVFVIPQLTEMYKDFDAELPLPTLILMGISEFMVKIWPFLLLGIAAGLYSLSRWRKTTRGALAFDKFMLRLPVFGKLQENTMIAEMTRTLSLLVGAGISLVEALELVEKGVGNSLYQRAIRQITSDLKKGIQLSVSIIHQEIFPPLVPNMVAVGEETGKIDEILGRVSSYFEAEAEHAIKNLTTALEPLIMIVLGLGVGFLVVAIIMPIYNLTSQF